MPRFLLSRRLLTAFLCPFAVFWTALPSLASAPGEAVWGELPPLHALTYFTLQDRPATMDAFSEQPVVVRFNDGSRLRGRLVGETESEYLIDADQLGLIEVPKGNVAELLDPSVQLGPPPPGAEAPPPPGLFGTAVLAGWDKSIAIGFTGKSGDSDSLDLYARFSGDYSDEFRRWRVRANYFYGLAEGENTKNEGFANARRDWLQPDEPYFFWSEGRADYNEFRSYRSRLGLFAGLGYNVYNRKTFKLISRLGVGGSYEFGIVDDFKPEALASVEADWKITDRQSLTFINTLFPDLENAGESRNFTEVTYTIKVQAGRGLAVKIGAQNEYESVTLDNSQHNDLTYFAALQLDF